MIKYHDNINGEQYGPDHKLTNNWNPDCDYGNEYVKVYFRINTPSFNCINGLFNTADDRNKWYKEASKVIRSLGILEDCGYTVEHSNNKQAYLYAHPQNISGIVLKNDVRKIAEAINNMELSSLRWVDLYETVYVISNEDYEKFLDGNREEIRKKIFEVSHTTRTTKYYDALDVSTHVAKLFGLHRLGYEKCSGQTVNYVLKIVDNMIAEGYIKCFVDEDIMYIRSLNKTEQKKMKLFL